MCLRGIKLLRCMLFKNIFILRYIKNYFNIITSKQLKNTKFNNF